MWLLNFKQVDNKGEAVQLEVLKYDLLYYKKWKNFNCCKIAVAHTHAHTHTKRERWRARRNERERDGLRDI